MLVGSCVGNNYRKTFFYFCNPATTKISNKLGFFEEGLKDTVPNFFNFAFGYDDSTDTYKVVAFRPGGTEVRVFNLGDNYFWRDIQNSPGHFTITHSRYKWEDISIGQIFIISLDLRTETYTELMLPSGLNEVPREAPILRVLKNCLCFSHDFEGTHLIIWQMIEYGVKESWTQLLKISYEVLQNIHHNLETGHYSYCLPLYLSDTLVFANDSEEHAILYNMRDNSVERTSITIPKSLWMEAKDYVESLVWYS
ncbi:putative F-box associated interaction domain-containing protein [Medicago truncatula]|uniref:Putative F-box associated interaction domain-containing protein n=1 Tax=Medicago truncatula TaxID=3880 RepID=A0A396J0F4_MEDTR|nr:putative F-box associated interaction domain-containing protein [Medicago truncatula]